MIGKGLKKKIGDKIPGVKDKLKKDVIAAGTESKVLAKKGAAVAGKETKKGIIAAGKESKVLAKKASDKIVEKKENRKK